MKKILFTLACMLSMSISAFGLANSAVLLQHGDQVTTYLADQLQDALDAAVDGDAIFLNKGTFSGFTITKQITIRGAGEETIIDGDVNIEIPDNPTLTRTLMESLQINGVFAIDMPINGIRLEKVHINNEYSYIGANIYDAHIEQCYIKKLSLTGYVKSLIVSNTKIDLLESTYHDYSDDIYMMNQDGATFINCNINIINGWHGGSPGTFGTIINSIIFSRDFLYYQPFIVNTVLVSTLMSNRVEGSVNENSEMVNCYVDNEDFISQESGSIYEPTTEELIEKGYFGNDGTVVGIYGGTTPYVDGLTPIAPTVTESLLKVDNENKKLNVQLSVSPK